MTQTQKKFIFCFVLVAFVGTAFFASKIYAETTVLGDKISEQKLDIGGKGLILSQRIKDGRKIWFLTEEGRWKMRTTELSGFEEDIRTCNKQKYAFGDKHYYCFRGIVGVHSENYALLDIETLKPLVFSDSGDVSDNIFSDVPSARIDGQNFIIDQRDYDLDPLSNSIRYFFRFSDDQFVFDKKINIKYDEGNNNFLGDL